MAVPGMIFGKTVSNNLEFSFLPGPLKIKSSGEKNYEHAPKGLLQKALYRGLQPEGQALTHLHTTFHRKGNPLILDIPSIQNSNPFTY